uniref:Pheophorbide a oxygenase domain-containing protein n=1 Tax=Quercus lobata TaxID=97700 RepID=A0A7N2KLD4_QUELO
MIEKLDINGFKTDQRWSNSKFLPPCVFYAYTKPVDQANGSESSVGTKKETSVQRSFVLIFFCIPVSPGNSRLIWSFPRNFGVWIDKVVPRWTFHVAQNLILDSDLYLLHIELLVGSVGQPYYRFLGSAILRDNNERKIMDVGNANWHKACFVPTKSDALVIGFRKWLNKYAGGQVDWRGKYSGALPPTPPKEQLMDRYWSHVVNCRSCNIAYKGLNALEVVLQVVSIVSIGIAAAAKQGAISAVARTTVVLLAVLFYASSRLLTHFIYKNFHYHGYDHAFR